jgi:cell division inhibitor SepF
VGIWDSIKARLGLGDEYDDDYDEDDSVRAEADGYEPRTAPGYRNPYDTGDSPGVRRVTREPDLERAHRASARHPHEPIPGPGIQAVPQVKMHIVEPRTFTEAQQIADRFKLGVPVILNLTSADPELTRRLIDFASGLTYGLNGGLQKVSDKVFMLTPANVDVSAEQRRVLRDKGLFENGL